MSFKETEAGRIPSDWSIKTLEECTKLIIDYRGKTPKKLGSDWSEDGIKAISAKNIKDGSLVREETIRYVDNELYEKWMKEEVKFDDIIMTSEAPLGECMIWESDEKVVLSQRLYGIRANRDIVCPKYLYNYMNTNIYRHELDSRASGTTVLGIRQSELLKTNIVVPSIEEQVIIGKYMDDINKKIEVNNKTNKRLEEMAGSIFKYWFVDFEFPNEEGKPYKSSGGEMVESELGMIPKGWEVVEMSEVFSFKKGKKPKEILENKENEDYSMYLTIDVLNQNSKLFAKREKIVECDNDDTLMVMDGASSGSIYTGMSGIVGSTLAKLEVKNHGFKTFVFQVLKYREKDIKSHLTGSAIPHADKGYIHSQKVVMPMNIETLKKLTNLLKLNMNKIRTNNLENENLSNLRDTLLPKLMSGEIRVPINK